MATTIVGIERKNENSRAEARDIPASCPAAMVDIERDVPGKTADRIWHAPIQIGLAEAHVFHVPGVDAASGSALSGGFRLRVHRVDDPHDDAADQQRGAHDFQALQMLADDFGQQKRGNRRDHEGDGVRLNGCVRMVRSPRSPLGNVERNFAMRSRK